MSVIHASRPNRLARDELIVAGHRVRLPGPPVLWRDDHGLPIHGLLGAHPGWSVHEADADGHVAPRDTFAAVFTIGVT